MIRCPRCRRPRRHGPNPVGRKRALCNPCRDATNCAQRSTHLRVYLRRLSTLKGRGKHLRLSDLITLWRRQGGRCALSGIPMTHATGFGTQRTNVSVDRIDPLKGYAPDNIQLVCYMVNMMRRELSTNELLDWCSAIVSWHRDD